MEFYHESSVAELLEAAMDYEVARMKSADHRQGRVIAWERLRLLKKIQAKVEASHA